MSTTHSRRTKSFTIKTIWGIAKSPELLLTDTELYDVVTKETGKDSLKELTQKEINLIVYALQQYKDSAKGVKSSGKRTDEGGNAWTNWQRKRIYELTGKLGWNDNNARIDGFVKKMFGVESIKWLDNGQCSKLIEILKKICKKRGEKQCRRT